MRTTDIEQFIDLIKSAIGSGYVYGMQGSLLRDQRQLDILISIYGKKRYFKEFGSSADASKWIGTGKLNFDCSGLIVWALMQLKLISRDYSASMIYDELCSPITKDQSKKGDLCFNADLTHVGILVGDSKVVEARGTEYGVILDQTIPDRFSRFARLKVGSTKDTPVEEFQELYGLVKDNQIGPITTAKVLECIIKINETRDFLNNEPGEGKK